MILLNVKLQVILSIFILLMLANFKRVVIMFGYRAFHQISEHYRS